ncbi:DUF4386 family protein [Candidatus Chloroploca sp. M-50]|uniref:DUF4386 family protein n=1 Tax=Candidatus Chloroploca mongolica TaxID=2528176 RepID=A0ABS4D665_9CHLR|nr:DUF4386 family protein [Candidatus Chloroploca mongolica]MBP1464936.1 DUF4386 family protein [Candidatus Chloroploca mongolica]
MSAHTMDMPTFDPRYQSLYRLGGSASILTAVFIVLAIGAYFIWPYSAHETTIQAIFDLLQTDRLSTLIALDVSMLVIGPISLLLFLALYAALRRVDEAVALLALALNLLAVGLIIVCRPLVELVMLSDHYAAAADASEQMRLLAAGEVLRAQLDGTAWVMQTAFLMLAGLLNSSLMLRTPFFSQATAWLGIVISALGLGFFLPTIGPLFLFINTIGSIPWCLLIARYLFDIAQVAAEPA